MFRRRDTVLITSAAQSRGSEIQQRQLRYLASMLFRVICFVLAVVVLHGWPRFVGIAIAVVMPWIAVVLANGGPAPDRKRPVVFEPQPATPAAPGVLTADPHRVVDSDGWVDGEGRVHASGPMPAAGPAETAPAGPAETAPAGPAETAPAG